MSKMGDTAMDFTGEVETVKELWSQLYSQYHEKRWGADSILFEKFLYLCHSDCESPSDYIEKFCSFSQRLSNMRLVYKNWWLV